MNPKRKCLPCLVHDVKPLKGILLPILRAKEKALKKAGDNYTKIFNAVEAELEKYGIYGVDSCDYVYEVFNKEGIFEIYYYVPDELYYIMERK